MKSSLSLSKWRGASAFPHKGASLLVFYFLSPPYQRRSLKSGSICRRCQEQSGRERDEKKVRKDCRGRGKGPCDPRHARFVSAGCNLAVQSRSQLFLSSQVFWHDSKENSWPRRGNGCVIVAGDQENPRTIDRIDLGFVRDRVQPIYSNRSKITGEVFCVNRRIEGEG